MKRREFLQTLTASMAQAVLPARTHAAVADAVSTGEAVPASASQSILWYRSPANKWLEALPLGNGRIGAMVFGSVANERIQLNEDTIWSGGPYDPTNPSGPKALPEIRRLVFADENLKAHRLFGRNMFGQAIPQMQYQPLGNLWLTFPDLIKPADRQKQLSTDLAVLTPIEVKDYRRQLDLDEAITSVTFRADGISYHREVFVSVIDQVAVVRLTADTPGKISFIAALTTAGQEQQDRDARYDSTPQGELITSGRAMSDEGIDGKIRFYARARILPEGGSLRAGEGDLTITGANAVTILISARTSFLNYKDASANPEPPAIADIERAAKKSYAELRRDHIAEHQRLFRRVHLDLGASPSANLPTDERLKRYPETGDPDLAALYFQFGRYLLISCSRPGSMPANLQGIWNDSTSPSWGGKYTTNINLQMNYWPVEVANLSECFEPLSSLLTKLVEPGASVARVNYGVNGWVLHQNTDLWLACAPMDGPTWGTFATAGAWLCTHLWEHYQFHGSKEELRAFYPILKGSAQFFLETLVEHPKYGWMVTCPSMSPEHYKNTPASSIAFWDEVTNLHLKGTTICAGPTMDMSILRSLFESCIAASRILDEDLELRSQWSHMHERLAPLQVGRYGQLQEWLEDCDDPEDRHRHMSPLWGLYPGNEITRQHTPKLAAAAEKLIEFRGEGGPGWTMAWKICLWARLMRGERAAQVLRTLLTSASEDRVSYKDGGTYMNLLNALPFQIDGNLGATAGIAEMLLQSHAGEIHLLPALPKAWAIGSLRGFRARGGFEVDITWKESLVQEVKIHSQLGGTCKVRNAPQYVKILTDEGTIPFTHSADGLLSFATKPGTSYSLHSA